MKTLLIMLFTILSLNSGLTQDLVQAREIIFESTHTTTLRVEKDTFIPNIMGYACPVPAINLEKYNVWDRALNHQMSGNYMVKSFALRVEDPNMRFCSMPSAIEVFGEEFKIGAKIQLEITTVREIIYITNRDGTIRKQLVETISSELNGKKLFSQGGVALGIFK